MKELTRTFVIQNKNTKELFKSIRGHRFFDSKVAAINAFNYVSQRRRGVEKLKEQKEWEIRTLIITQEALV